MKKKMFAGDIPIEIERKKIKHMYLKVLPPDGRVRMSVPERATEKEIRDCIRAKQGWIIKGHAKVAARAGTVKRTFEEGDAVLLWGREYKLHISGREGRSPVELEAGTFILNMPVTASQEERAALTEQYRRTVLAEEIYRMEDECSRITKQRADEWRIRKMKTRWGSCSILKRRIWISLELTYHPKECLRYVMIHELTHFYTGYHDAEFKSYMDRFCPDWREIKKKL